MKTQLLALVAAASVTALACAPTPEAAVDLEAREQRNSYAVGVDMARNLQSQSLPLEVDAVLAGLRDQLTGNTQLSEEEVAAALNDFRTMLAENAVGAAEENRRRGEELMAENGQRPEVTTTESGLQYEVLTAGDGVRPVATDTVTVHYVGTTIDGVTFDSSRDRDEPSTFALDRVINGWTEGLALMPVGSTYKFWVPADLAYRNSAPPGAAFGPGSTLVFEVELLGIADRE